MRLRLRLYVVCCMLYVVCSMLYVVVVVRPCRPGGQPCLTYSGTRTRTRTRIYMNYSYYLILVVSTQTQKQKNKKNKKQYALCTLSTSPLSPTLYILKRCITSLLCRNPAALFISENCFAILNGAALSRLTSRHLLCAIGEELHLRDLLSFSLLMHL